MLKKLMQMISHTRLEEIDCGEVYKVIDLYAEAVTRGEDPSQLLPMVKQHLDMCISCQEEYQALLRILEGVAGA